MASIIITGATGTVGSAVLTHALASPAVAKVTVLARRAPDVAHPKLETVLLPSSEYPAGFSEFPPALVERLRARGASAVVWALGISQTAVGKDEYIKITEEYTLTAARALASPSFRFIYVSGEGADQAEKSWTLFGNVKGRTERALADMERAGGMRVANLRPGGVVPSAEHAANVSWSTRLAVKAAGFLIPSRMITSAEIATAAVGLAVRDDGWETRDKTGLWIDNTGLKALAKRFSEEMAN